MSRARLLPRAPRPQEVRGPTARQRPCKRRAIRWGVLRSLPAPSVPRPSLLCRNEAGTLFGTSCSLLQELPRHQPSGPRSPQRTATAGRRRCIRRRPFHCPRGPAPTDCARRYNPPREVMGGGAAPRKTVRLSPRAAGGNVTLSAHRTPSGRRASLPSAQRTHRAGAAPRTCKDLTTAVPAERCPGAAPATAVTENPGRTPWAGAAPWRCEDVSTAPPAEISQDARPVSRSAERTPRAGATPVRYVDGGLQNCRARRHLSKRSACLPIGGAHRLSRGRASAIAHTLS